MAAADGHLSVSWLFPRWVAPCDPSLLQRFRSGPNRFFLVRRALYLSLCRDVEGSSIATVKLLVPFTQSLVEHFSVSI